MAKTSRAHTVTFEFSTPNVEPKEDGSGLHVVDFVGLEVVSRPYRFELNLMSLEPDIAFDDVLNQQARLALTRHDAAGEELRPEYVHGVVTDFQQGGAIGQGGAAGDRYLYRVTLRPALWLLSLTRRTRVFQHQSVPDIIGQVLGEHGLTHEIESESYPTREYVIQQGEDDLAFLTRLMAHEGFRYGFRQDDHRETVVISDRLGTDPWIADPPEVTYAPGPGAIQREEEAVAALTFRERAVPGKVVLRDYNFRTPTAGLEVTDEGSGAVAEKYGEHYEYGQHYKDTSDGARLAKVRREELQALRRTVAGRGSVTRFHAGHRFTLANHFRDDLNADYLLLAVRHYGTQDHGASAHLMGPGAARPEEGREVDYWNEFGCIPAAVPFRPPRAGLPPAVFPGVLDVDATLALDIAGDGGGPPSKMLGIMTAKVIGDGPYGAVDDQGQYKAQMPFDRDDAGSRPMRMAQPYSGPNYGFHFPSHAGTEVVFACIDGDPDRPIALGTVPNPDNASPVTSSNSHNSTIRTWGQNELTLDDTQGAENVYLFGTKDWTVKITNDHVEEIGRDVARKVGRHEEVQIGKNQTEDVGANQTKTVGGNRSKRVAGSQSEQVGGTKSISVGGTHDETIGGAMSLSVGASKTEAVATASAVTVGAAYSLNVGGVMSAAVGGMSTETVGVSKSVEAGTNVTQNAGQNITLGAGKDVGLQAGKDVTVQAGGKGSVQTGKDFTLRVGKKAVFEVADQLTLKCGSAEIVLKKNGDISIKGKKIDVKGSGKVTIKGSQIAEN